ncbi:hypothetical protein L249_4325 [Ophiocordyceps polyrhachis-furcata BCC 54312]|uniref:Uncharacterized protein n=1 Tax=Ophiocordyceps polyrhachis-furcata BCC 54312 TaxID=1330021 RepID=A0A367L7P8_9HYPO|nr:hypothetical protein L249_4325 [Ophiocordyceps polyrhachis-furcata BCC 54312]
METLRPPDLREEDRSSMSQKDDGSSGKRGQQGKEMEQDQQEKGEETLSPVVMVQSGERPRQMLNKLSSKMGLEKRLAEEPDQRFDDGSSLADAMRKKEEKKRKRREEEQSTVDERRGEDRRSDLPNG